MDGKIRTNEVLRYQNVILIKFKTERIDFLSVDKLKEYCDDVNKINGFYESLFEKCRDYVKTKLYEEQKTAYDSNGDIKKKFYHKPLNISLYLDEIKYNSEANCMFIKLILDISKGKEEKKSLILCQNWTKDCNIMKLRDYILLNKNRLISPGKSIYKQEENFFEKEGIVKIFKHKISEVPLICELNIQKKEKMKYEQP